MNPEKLRSWLASVATDLRSRKLLPVLVLLIAIAVAIPLLLSHSGKAARVNPLPPAPVVTAPVPTAAATSTGRRHEPSQNYLTGPSHNPFISKTETTTTASGTSSSAKAGSTSTSAAAPGTTSPSQGASTTSSGHGTATVAKTITVASPVVTKTVSKTTTVPNSLPYTGFQVVASLQQSGAGSAPTVFHNLSRDQLLPNDSSPFATFLGVRPDRKTAVFVLADDATVTGAGRCAPSASSCTFLTLEPGETTNVVVSPAGGAPSTFTLKFVQIDTVHSSASAVAVDQDGAYDVKQAAAYVPQLKTVSYARYTGLLSIALGSTVPVSP